MITVQDLQTAFYEVADNGPVDAYIADIRESVSAKYNVKRNSLLSLFDSAKMSLWQQAKTKNGHVKYTHKITRVVVGFQAHNDNTLDPGGAEELMKTLQKHVNILGNDIFHYRVRNWKTVPDFNQALANYNQWRAAQAVGA